MPLSLAEFVERWKAVTLTERAAAQSHFIDLCEFLGQPHPAADQTGDSFTVEKHVSKPHGGKVTPMCGSAVSSPGNTRASIRTAR